MYLVGLHMMGERMLSEKGVYVRTYQSSQDPNYDQVDSCFGFRFMWWGCVGAVDGLAYVIREKVVCARTYQCSQDPNYDQVDSWFWLRFMWWGCTVAVDGLAYVIRKKGV